MFTRHVSHQLAALIDGQLAEQEARHVEIHATQCARCRAEREQVSFGMEILEQLPLVEAPDAVWVSIEAALREHRSRKTWAVHWWRLAFAASLVLALAIGVYWRAAPQSGLRLAVVPIGCSPVPRPRTLRPPSSTPTTSRSTPPPYIPHTPS